MLGSGSGCQYSPQFLSTTTSGSRTECRQLSFATPACGDVTPKCIDLLVVYLIAGPYPCLYWPKYALYSTARGMPPALLSVAAPCTGYVPATSGGGGKTCVEGGVRAH